MHWPTLTACAMAAAFLAGAAKAGDLPSVQEKMDTCLACHGVRGVSENDGVPSLAGEPDLFIQWQLVFFRSGRLKSEIMDPIAAELSDTDIRALGKAVATLPPAQLPATTDSDPKLTAFGSQLAGERHCNSCHGASFAGQQATPRLAGQREEVLVKALHDYKSGARFGTGVAAMPEVASQLEDHDIEALAHYLSHLR